MTQNADRKTTVHNLKTETYRIRYLKHIMRQKALHELKTIYIMNPNLYVCCKLTDPCINNKRAPTKETRLKHLTTLKSSRLSDWFSSFYIQSEPLPGCSKSGCILLPGPCGRLKQIDIIKYHYMLVYILACSKEQGRKQRVKTRKS